MDRKFEVCKQLVEIIGEISMPKLKKREIGHDTLRRYLQMQKEDNEDAQNSNLTQRRYH